MAEIEKKAIFWVLFAHITDALVVIASELVLGAWYSSRR